MSTGNSDVKRGTRAHSLLINWAVIGDIRFIDHLPIDTYFSYWINGNLISSNSDDSLDIGTTSRMA